MAFLEITHISKSFGGLKALQDLSLNVEEGQIFSVIGPNGAGKSTLFNCINGLYKPDQGEVRFLGKNITGLKPHVVAEHRIGRTFQNLELFENMTTMENMMLGRHLHMQTGLFSASGMLWKNAKAAKEEIENRVVVEKIIDLLELQGIRDKFVSQLPYGAKKLVELGRALAAEPKLLLLDEPAAGLTNDEKVELVYWINDIRDELGITILMIEHNMQMVTEISDRILAINFGKKLAEGSVEEVVSHPEVIKAYLGDAV